MTETSSLTSLADRLAIADLIYRYCRAVDRNDADLAASVWHEDGLADYEGLFNGTGHGFIDFAIRAHQQAPVDPQQAPVFGHQVSNIIIELDGDRASSEAYVCSFYRFQQDGQFKQATTWGRYVDQWSRRNGRWGIDKRVFINDSDEIRDVTPMSKPTRSRRDRSDPSYAALGRAR
jgi:hypothetical protein